MPKRAAFSSPRAGDRFSEWTVLDVPDTGSTPVGQRDALCRCSCGREKAVSLSNLIYGRSTRCRPCSSRKKFTTHGESDSAGNTRIYRIWKAMKWRCNPKNAKDRPDYSDRGIRVCQEWLNDYPTFRDWAKANGYAEGLTIDRRENDRGYAPDNCRWVGYSEQARNTRRNRLVTAFGEIKNAEAWSEDPRCAVNAKALRRRLRLGWPDELAVTVPCGACMGPRGRERAADALS